MDFGLLTTITGLGIADAINVCAIAVLTMVLVAILIQHPDKRKKVLYSGLMFSLAVFIMYFGYGVIIYTLFKGVAELIQGASSFIYKIFIILIMIAGALNIKDFFMYRKGSFATEMPIFLRAKVKRIIEKITSPAGAFIVGLGVTLFLLPCTMMPLFGAINKLSESGYTFIQSIPWLIYYNFLFIIPMLIITFIIYLGFKRVEEVSGWKERNIKILHLIAGILLFLVGLALLIGWI